MIANRRFHKPLDISNSRGQGLHICRPLQAPTAAAARNSRTRSVPCQAQHSSDAAASDGDVDFSSGLKRPNRSQQHSPQRNHSSSSSQDTAAQPWPQEKQVRVDPRHVTVWLKAASSPEQLLQLVRQHAADLNHIHLSAAYNQAVRVCGSGESAAKQQLLSELHQLSVRLQQQCGARELSNIIWACGELCGPATVELLQPLFQQASTVQQADPQARVDPRHLTVWLKAASSPEQLLQLVQQHAADLNHIHLSAAYTQAVRVYGSGESAAKQQLLSELHQLCVRLQQQCGARELSIIISACGELGSPATVELLLPLFQQASTAQQADPQAKVDPRHLTVWVKAATSPEQLLQLVQQHAADLNHIHLSAAYTQAVRVCGRGESAAKQQLLSELHQLSVRLQQQCGARELSIIISACGELSSPATVELLLPLFQQASTLQQDDAQGRVDPRHLTVWLKGATSPEQLLQLVQQHAADLNHIHLSAAYTQAVKVCGRGESAAKQQLLSELHQLSVRLQQQFSARQLSNIIHACDELSSPATVKLLLPLFQQASTLQQDDAQGRVDPPLLTAWLKAATSPEQLLQLVQQHAADLNHIHLSAAYTQAARLCRHDGAAAQQQAAAPVQQQQLLSELHQLSVRLQQQCGARELSNVIWACGELSSPTTAKLLLPVFLQASSLRQLVPQDVSNVLLAAADLQLQLTATELQQLLERFAAVLADADPQAVSNTLWVVATMGQQVPPQQLQQLLGRLAAALSDAAPQSVANSLWAVATMGQQVPTRQLQQLLGRLVAVFTDANPQAVSNTLWAVATMGQQVPPQQLQQLVRRLAAVLSDVNSQNASNTLWAVATMGQQVLPQQLQQLVGRLVEVLSHATAQNLSNTLWAVATMRQQVQPQQLQQLLGRFEAVLPEAKPQDVSSFLWAVATMGQQVPPQQLQQLLRRLVAVLSDANPQNLSNTLWAVATMGQQVQPQQLQQLLGRMVAVLSGANPQAVSNTLWAVATMGLQVPPQQLQLVLFAFVELLPAANRQTVSNTLWACGKISYLPKELLQSMQQHPQQLQQLITAADEQDLANMAWACGQLGYRGQLLPGALLQQAVQLLQDGGTRSFTSQAMCILCWSAAVLDLQQCVPLVLQLAAAASQVSSTAIDDNFRQLHQVHLWLLDSQLPTPGQGLTGVLNQQQLEQCRDSWEQQLTATAKQQSSRLQQSVYAALLQLPRDTWQQQPQPEQPTADKACLIDIAAVTASGVKVAIEVEGPQHYVQPECTLSGPTLYRNCALAARGYALVSIPHWQWRSLQSTEEQQQFLLTELLAAQQPSAVAAAQQPPLSSPPPAPAE